MYKIIKIKVLFALIMATLFISLTGCVGTEDIHSAEPINIAFVVGIADDETKFNDGIDELTTLPTKPNTAYAFISVEGDPVAIGEAGIIPDLSDRGYTDVMMERVRAGIMADLTERLISYEPTSPEIDMAAATELAVRTLNAHAVNGRQNVLVYYCGGKSTTGLINMLETPVYKMDIEASVTAVAQKMNIDMSDIDVVWYCCGDFGTTQPKLSANEKSQLKAFYEQLFTALGAKSVTFRNDLPSVECYLFSSTPVSCMAVEGTESGLKDLVVLEPEVFEKADSVVLETPIVIPESMVCYHPDSAEFIDPISAAKAIQPVAEFLSDHPENDILIYGTCAGEVDSEYTLWLGKARAESVKQALVEAGIDDNRITAVTVKAIDDPYYQFGLGTGSEASANRKTVIVDISTEFAQQILQNQWVASSQ